jgi:unsaturated chondroitin disaccharide hydrolase
MELLEFRNAYEASIEKIIRNSRKIGISFPQVASGENGSYNREEASYWTGGFWGGLLWMAYRESGNHQLFELACEIEEAQDEALNEFTKLHHDVGFMWLPTAVAHYQITGCKVSRVRGLKAAAVLASRFNLKGGFLRAWNEEQRENSSGLVIIDCLMNLPLLYWASREMKDPRYWQMACAHTDTVLRTFVREDYTVPHIMVFDSGNGGVIGPAKGQGKSLDSVWSRGQAWAIYGFAIGYRETGNTEYLKISSQMAQHFYENLPEDKVPYWDFCADKEEQYAKDSSASCIAASGMLELAKGLEGSEKERFIEYAKSILKSLMEQYACFGDETEGIITRGTVNFACNQYINVPIIYGDFYFLEALGKLLGREGFF